MKKVLLGAVGLLAACASSPTFAADMAVKAPPPAPLPMIYNWSGFYIGANGGWGQSHNCLDFITAVGTVASGCDDRSGGVAGGQIGYRWQASQFVFGLEAQGDWADLNSTSLSLLDPSLSTQVKTDAIGLFPGQIGWAWNAALFYVKGGGAWANDRFFTSASGVIPPPPLAGVPLQQANDTRWGWMVGVGVEYAFTPNWSVKAEYNYLDLGTRRETLQPVPANCPGCAPFQYDIRQRMDLVKIGLNYRFGWAGPVVAKY